MTKTSKWMVETATFRGVRNGKVGLFWFEVPPGMSKQEAANTAVIRGPFKTEAEVEEDQRVTLLGPECEVRDGGMWDPAWDKPQ